MNIGSLHSCNFVLYFVAFRIDVVILVISTALFCLEFNGRSGLDCSVIKLFELIVGANLILILNLLTSH